MEDIELEKDATTYTFSDLEPGTSYYAVITLYYRNEPGDLEHWNRVDDWDLENPTTEERTTRATTEYDWGDWDLEDPTTEKHTTEENSPAAYLVSTC